MSDSSSLWSSPVLLAIGLGVAAVVYIWNRTSNNDETAHGHHPQPQEREKLERLPVGKLTLQEISKFNGANKSRILVSVCGRIFDLTKGRDFYGHPSGPYNCFTGADASYMLGAMSLERDHRNKKDFEQDGDHQITLSDWISRYRAKYPIVGRLEGFENLCPESWREAGNDDVIDNNIDLKSDKFKLITTDELTKCATNNSFNNEKCWVSVCGFVFDVKSAEIVYESMYGDFPDAVGHDISIALATNKFDKDTTYNKPVNDIKDDKEKLLKLKKYLKIFSESYPIIGKLNNDTYSLDNLIPTDSDEWDIVNENDANDDNNDNDQKTKN